MTTNHTTPQLHATLSNPHRFAIMDYLAGLRSSPPEGVFGGAVSVNSVSIAIGLSQTWTSKCLRDLEAAGLVTRRQEDQTVWNRMADGVVWPIVWRQP